jgi:hypothetical protein
MLKINVLIKDLPIHGLQKFCVTHYKNDFSHKTLETLYTTWIIQFGSKIFTEGF